MPLVTIAIPTYNQSEYLEKAIQSAIAQDYNNKEIIVAEDSENEQATKNIQFLKTKYPFIQFFINEKRLGRVGNYKKLLTEYSNGDFYINLDGDDYFTNNNYISNAIEKIKKEGYEDILFFQGSHLAKLPATNVLVYPKINANDEVILAKDYLKRYFDISHFSHMSTLYNRKAAMQAGFYERDILSADIFSVFKMATDEPEKKVILSKEISGNWIKHEKNISKSLNLKQHLKNFNLYTTTFYRQLKSPAFSNFPAIKWYSKAFFHYWYSHYLKKFITRRR